MKKRKAYQIYDYNDLEQFVRQHASRLVVEDVLNDFKGICPEYEVRHIIVASESATAQDISAAWETSSVTLFEELVDDYDWHPESLDVLKKFFETIEENMFLITQ